MTLRRVLVELSVVEQRYRAVLEVQSGSTVSEVAARFGVSRQAVHRWWRWYREHGLAGLSDRFSRPHPISRAGRESIDAHLTVVFAALAVTRLGVPHLSVADGRSTAAHRLRLARPLRRPAAPRLPSAGLIVPLSRAGACRG